MIKYISIGFWLSYFVLHWLYILGIVQGHESTIVYFAVWSVLSGMFAIGEERVNEKAMLGAYHDLLSKLSASKSETRGPRG